MQQSLQNLNHLLFIKKPKNYYLIFMYFFTLLIVQLFWSLTADPESWGHGIFGPKIKFWVVISN